MIKRSIFADLRDHLSQKEITLLVGPRQVGKTYLMELLRKHLEKIREKIVWFNLDVEADSKWFKSQSLLISRIELEIGKGRGYVFVDEIQRKENAGIFLKGIHDMQLPYKFIVSGSGSLELKEKIHESLAGRKRIFKIMPISFTEFVSYKTDYKYEKRLNDFFKIDSEMTQLLFEEYMQFGGYPKVILAHNIVEKTQVMGEIVTSYIEKDLSVLLKIEKTEAVINLLRILAAQTGQLTNRRELSASLEIADQTVKKYLWYLEKTFMLYRLHPYFSRIKKTIIKQPKYYFYDLGLRNYMLGTFGSQRKNDGYQFENYVAIELYRRLPASSSIYFWRTRDGAEVDFIVVSGLNPIPIEVKYADYTKRSIPKSLQIFIKSFSSKKAYIIHVGNQSEMLFSGIPVTKLPFYDPGRIFV